MERGFNARTTLETLRNVAEWFGSVRGRRKAILFVSEGIDYDIYDIIAQSGSNHQSASTVLDATRDAIGAATRPERGDLRHRPARPHRSRRRVDRDRHRSPTTRRSASARARCRTSCACRRTACARCRRKPAASPSSTRTTSPPPSSASSRTTARTTSWRITRRTRDRDGPTRSTCA